jgi:ATP-dependent protease ClpP protease subunit
MLKINAIVLGLMLPLLASSGEVIKTNGRDDDMVVSRARIIFKGEIQRGDAQKINNLIPFAISNSHYATHGLPSHHHAPVLLINSSGGDVQEAMAIGRLLRKHKAMVIVDEKCISACTLVLAGASSRVVLGLPPFGKTKLGIHRIRSSSPQAASLSADASISQYNNMKQLVYEYLREMDVSVALAEKMFKIGSEDVYFLNDAEAEQWSLSGTDPAYAEYMRIKDIETYGADCITKQDNFNKCLSSGVVIDICRKKTKFYGCKPLTQQ